jgi:lipopolysaccharide transport system permease protein/teichoic acid transport system permease protein
MNRIKDWTLLFLRFVVTLFKSRSLVYSLALRDIRSRYLGSYLNFLWAFVQPTITILLIWFVFDVGFKVPPVENYPFVLWLIAAIIPWFFFSESLGNATSSILDYSYLVKKVVFKVSVIPIIKILSALFIHFFFIGFMFLAFLAYGYTPRWCNLQIIYYLFAAIVLVVGLSWITASLVIFVKDVGQVVAMLLQFGFWLTPILWSIKMVPERYQPLMKLNPVFYITEGYRNSFISGIWFWEDPHWALYFWILTGIIFVLGAFIFIKLRPHFADVL